MEDEFGRPLSDDGQWVWDGRAWRPSAAQAGPGGPVGPGTGGLEPTREAPRGYQQTGPQSEYYQSVYPTPAGPGGPGSPNSPGGPPPEQPWYRRRLTLVVIIGALLVLSAVLVTVLLVTRGNDNNTAPPSPSPSTSAPTSPPPITEAPTTPPPTSPPPTSPPPTTPPPTTPPPVTTVVPGIYDCTNAGQFVGAVTFRGHTYTTDNQSRGTYQLDASTNGISFTGGDLDGFTGTYVPSGPSMDLTSTGETLHCAQ